MAGLAPTAARPAVSPRWRRSTYFPSKCGSDAIVGAAKQMHTVLPEACYACGLCVAECPTDAIVMTQVKPTLATWHWPKPAAKQPAAAS